MELAVRAMQHPLVRFDLPMDWAYWERFDREYLCLASELVVLKLDGWRESVGVQAEIDLAIDLGLPIRFLAPEAIHEGEATNPR